jgi:hypothetical protein
MGWRTPLYAMAAEARAATRKSERRRRHRMVRDLPAGFESEASALRISGTVPIVACPGARLPVPKVVLLHP